MFTIELNTMKASDFVEMAGIGQSNEAQRFFCNELLRLSVPYTPFQNGVLMASAYVASSGDEIVYNTPYARYLWYGKLMVDPITNKGAFFNPNYGFWSRPNTPKVLTDRNLNFTGAPMRGPFWVFRAYEANKYALAISVQEYIERKLR
ncbi:MAG: minor capsid protein [Eubacteriales bacterium]|nr:minor capsid protein [Eubacteriales bacterium]